MLLLIFALYLLLASPVEGSVLLSASGLHGAVQISARVYGVGVRHTAVLSLEELSASFAKEAKKPKEGKHSFVRMKAMLNHPLFSVARQAMQFRRLDVRMRIGLEEAWSTALIVGSTRAALLSLLSCMPPVRAVLLEVAPDFAAPCFLIHAHCIFSVTLGDIMLAAASAAIKKK